MNKDWILAIIELWWGISFAMFTIFGAFTLIMYDFGWTFIVIGYYNLILLLLVRK